MQWIDWALVFALLRAGNNIAARIAMMAITTRSSISVKAWRAFDWDFISVRDYDSLWREPQTVKLPGPCDSISDDVLPIDDDRVRRNRIPNGRTERRSGFQLKISEIRRPRQNHVRVNSLDI